MQTKFDVGDKVKVVGEVIDINIRKTGIFYTIRIIDGYGSVSKMEFNEAYIEEKDNGTET